MRGKGSMANKPKSILSSVDFPVVAKETSQASNDRDQPEHPGSSASAISLLAGFGRKAHESAWRKEDALIWPVRQECMPKKEAVAMKRTIGVMGSSGGALSRETTAKLVQLGRAIAEHGCILLTGGCRGLPYAAVQGARAAGGLVIGISPGLSREEHEQKYASPTEGFDVLTYTGSGLMGEKWRQSAHPISSLLQGDDQGPWANLPLPTMRGG